MNMWLTYGLIAGLQMVHGEWFMIEAYESLGSALFMTTIYSMEYCEGESN